MSTKFALRDCARCCRSAATAVLTVAMTIAMTTELAWAGEAAGTNGAPLTIDAALLSAPQVPVGGAACEASYTSVAASPFFPVFNAGGAPTPQPATGPWATCALPYEKGENGADCGGKHTIQFATSPNPDRVTAELVAYDVNGIVIKTLPVQNGDSVHMASKLSNGAFKMTTKNKGHEVFAPIPVLRITVEDEGQKATAFCSNIPWLSVVEPKGLVVTEQDNLDGGNATNVVAAAPHVDANTLSFKVDGVNIIPLLGYNVSTCTAAAPCGPTVVNINSTAVTVSNLRVDIATSIDQLASNTIKFSLENQECGGHVYVLDGEYLPNALKKKSSAQCHVDDVLDKGTSSIFGIRIDSPLAGDVITPLPSSINVTGEVCSGLPIVSASLNKKPLSLAGMNCVLGNGVTTGDNCSLPINDTIAKSDVENDLVNGAFPVGTFDHGANKLSARAADNAGHQAFKNVVFTAGNTATPGQNIQALLQQSALNLAVQNQMKAAVMPNVQQAMLATTTDIENAFVVGMTASATQDVFTKLCTAPLPAFKPNTDPPEANDPALVGKTPIQIFEYRTEQALLGKSKVKENVGVGCADDVDVTTTVTDVSLSGDLTCDVTFSQDKFHVTMSLPTISLDIHARGTSGEWDDDLCILQGAKIEGDFTGSISGIKLDFDVTESQLLGGAPQAPVFTPGSNASGNGDVGVSYCGALSGICAFTVTVFTFGAVDLLSGDFDFEFDKDFSKEITNAEPDPVALNKIKIDETVVANYDQELSGAVTSVEIDTTGIRAGLRGSFATTAIDSEIDPTLGGVLTPNSSLPTFAQVDSKDVFIGLADDTINMLFASMTVAGKLKGECSDTGLTVANLLDLNKSGATTTADCDTITGETPIAAAGAKGLCYGVIGANCETINLNPGNPNDINTATAQGICHGIKHDPVADNCDTIPLAPGLAGIVAAAAEKALCNNTPYPNIHGNQKLLFCARQELPPRMLLSDNDATANAVESTLRLNDLSVVLVLDRTGELTPGTPDGKIDTELAAVPGCFATGNPNNNDCSLYATCLDVAVDFAIANAPTGSGTGQCPADEPGLVINFQTLNYSEERGFVCGAGGGAVAGTDSAIVKAAQDSEMVKEDLTDRAQKAAPAICGAGLNLGLFGACGSAKAFSADAGAGPFGLLEDFIGLTCALEP